MRGRGTGRSAAATALLGLMIGGALALSACGAGGDSAPSAASAQDRGAAAAGRAQPPEALKQNSAGGGSADSSSSAGSGSAAAVELPGRDMIITAGLQVKTTDASAAAARAQSIAQAAGGFVASESIGTGTQVTQLGPVGGSAAAPDSANGGSPPTPAALPEVDDSAGSTQAVLVLRVPPQSLDTVLGSLAGKGSVTYQTRTATDVTGQVADVASRVSSARAAIGELRALIDKAASMNDLISLEQALAQRESDLEALEAQQKALSDQIQYATITVGYFTEGHPAAAPPVRTGFMRGLTTGWHGFLAVIRALLVTIGWLVPYAVVAVVLWWPVRRLLRWGKARRGSALPAAATAGFAPAGRQAADGGESPADD